LGFGLRCFTFAMFGLWCVCGVCGLYFSLGLLFVIVALVLGLLVAGFCFEFYLGFVVFIWVVWLVVGELVCLVV